MSLADILMVTFYTHTLTASAELPKHPNVRLRTPHKHPDRNSVHVPVEMALRPTGQGRFGSSDPGSNLLSADSEPVKTRKESRPPLSASLVRQPDVKQYAGLMVLQSRSGRRKSRYDEMVAVEDSIRGITSGTVQLGTYGTRFCTYEYSLTYHC